MTCAIGFERRSRCAALLIEHTLLHHKKMMDEYHYVHITNVHILLVDNHSSLFIHFISWTSITQCHHFLTHHSPHSFSNASFLPNLSHMSFSSYIHLLLQFTLMNSPDTAGLNSSLTQLPHSVIHEVLSHIIHCLID